MSFRYSIITIGCLFIIYCEYPFDTTPTNKNEILQLETKYDPNQRIIDTLSVKLEWTDFIIENFKEINILRFNEHRDILTYPVGTSINGWITVATITNAFKTSWVDTVRDDAVFQYRLRYINNDNNFYQNNSSISIRPTSHVFVPFEFDSIEGALESYIIDEGDTIFKCMSQFDTISDTTFGYKVDYKNDSTKIIVIEVLCDNNGITLKPPM
jgi:hypothetical protein